MNSAARLAEILSANAGRAGPLLPILHDVQAAFGCIDRDAEAEIACAGEGDGEEEREDRFHEEVRGRGSAGDGLGLAEIGEEIAELGVGEVVEEAWGHETVAGGGE